MKTTKENIVATPLDFHLLYKQTAPYILSGVLQLLADKLDARVLLCNSSILFFGKEEENSNNNNNNNNDKWLFSEYNLPQHVHSQWITSCQQSLLSGSKVKFTYTVGDFMFKVRVGVTKMDEPDCLWYCAKRKKSNSYSLPMTLFQKNLRESELRLVLDLMPSLVWCAKDSEVIYGNQMWLNYGGTIGASKTEEEDIKQHWGNICHPDDFAWSWERWQTSTKEREHFEGQVRIKKGDDDYRWFKMVTVPIQGEKNENKWVGVCTDIHDQKLQEAQAIIDKTISNFLAMMSHEMRTPLTGITGLLQWLIGTSLSPEQLDCCSTISICTDSLLVMINNLLDILKLEGGKVELVCNEMNPVKITEICVDMFSRLAEPKKIEMIYNIDVDMVDLVISDSYRYQQVLTNLLSNAVKFTHEGGEIEVSLKILSEEEATDFVKDLKHDVIDTLFDNTQWLQFSVRDTGKGIEKEKLPTIFRRFSQVEASLKTENQGGGLGLAICRNIATLMNGSVTAVSEPDKGSHFYFTIPVGVSANASPVFGPPPISIPSHPCSIILVNNPTLYDVFQRKLEHYSLEVITLEEYKKRTGEAWLKLPMQGYKLDKNFIWKGGKARRMSGKGSWSDLTTIVEETIEENYNKSDNGNNNNNNNNSNNNSTNSKNNNNNNNDDRQLRKSASDSATLKNKYNPCIVFIDQLLWHETDSSTRDWLKKNSKICVVRMGCKDITYEDGTRSLIKPVKDHMLYAECDIFLRSCELPKQPIVPSELSRSRDASLESLGIQFPLKVMVADDSTVNLQVAGKLLQKIGYKTISTCVNGSLVLEYFANNGPVEVVLMDMQMPGLDGCEATILLRQQYPTTVIHVIGFTATSFTEDREKCLSSGMCSFLSKPVKLSELEAELIKAWRAVNLRIPCNCNKHLELNRSETT